MLNTPVLSDEQIEAFERHGYLVLGQAFGPEEVKRIDAWAREMAALPEETGKHWVFHEKSLNGDGADLIGRIENIAPFHAGFAELSTVLKAPAAQLLGEDAALFKEKINFKMPGQTRRIYFATYNRLSEGEHMAQYYADKHKSYPPDIDPGREYVFRV